MVDIDQAMASLNTESAAAPSEAASEVVEAKPVEEQTAAPSETKESGSANTEAVEPEPREEVIEQNDKELSKSEYAFAKLKKKLKSRDAKYNSVVDAIGKISGVAYDPKNGNIEEYIKMQVEKAELERQKKSLEEDGEVRTLWEELRDHQARDIWNGNADALKIYEEQLKPARPELYKNIREKDPSLAVYNYLLHSKRAPLLEAAFCMPGGVQTFESILSDDEYTTKRNLEKLEDKLAIAVKENNSKVAKSAEKPKPPVSTPSVNEGQGKLNQTKLTPSLNDVAKWF